MTDKLKRHLDSVFAQYGELKQFQELKDELHVDLKERLNDLKLEGYDEETAFARTIDSIGDISELIETIQAKTRELQQRVGMDLSKSNLRESDFRAIQMQQGKFNYSDLQASDFRDSNLTDSIFKCSNLDKSLFDRTNLTGVEFNKSSLKGTSFQDAVLSRTVFKSSELGGVSFDQLTLENTVFDYCGLRGTTFRNTVLRNVSFKTDVKKTVFDGATMDKVTYAILKGYKANLANVTVV